MATASWIILAVEDVEDYLLAPQLNALRNAALGSTQADPLPQIIRDVASRIRAEVQGCPSNKVSPVPYSIPPSLKQAALAIIIARAQTRLTVLKLTEDQVRDFQSAERYLERVAACKVPVEQPEDVIGNVQAGGSAELAGYTPRINTIESLRGL
jgi:hypothetical protein